MFPADKVQNVTNWSEMVKEFQSVEDDVIYPEECEFPWLLIFQAEPDEDERLEYSVNLFLDYIQESCSDLPAAFVKTYSRPQKRNSSREDDLANE